MLGIVTLLSNKKHNNRSPAAQNGRAETSTIYCDSVIEVGVLESEYDAIAVSVPLAGSRLND